MFSQLEILADVLRIVTFTADARPARRHDPFIQDDQPHRHRVEDRVRRCYRRRAP